MEEKKIMTIEQAEKYSKALAGSNVWADKAAFDQLARVANMLAQSSMIPEKYMNKPCDCFIACDLGNRMNLSPLVVMQNLSIVHGVPSWSGSSCYALIENCGKFHAPDYVMVGEPGTASWGCYLKAKRKSDGNEVNGTTITMAMAQAEGWIRNPKWKSMPEQMLKYRAAAFFARAYCPEALMGLQTSEEVEDSRRNAAKDLNNELNALED